MSYFEIFLDRVWDTKFWLPNNSTWLELNEYTQIDYPSLLYTCLTLAVAIYVFRIVFEKYIASPIGRFLNVPDTEALVPNAALEAYYQDNQVLSESIIMLVAKETELNGEFIKDWFRIRRVRKKPSQLQKFNESAWRFTFYLVVWIYGIYVLYDKSWVWDTNNCWINYPRQYVDTSIYHYYVIEISFYFSLLASQFYDVKRKDFWQMFLHHIITLSLLSFSLMCNFIRIGSLIIVLHDTADSWLELAKMGSYAKLNWICDPVFAGFTIVWLLTRLMAYPYIILYTTTFEAVNHLENRFPAYYYFNILLYTLQVMHFIWFYMILRVAYKSLFKGVREDDRSECSDDSHEHEE